MIKLLAIPLAVLSFHSVVRPLSAPVRSQILAQKYWHQGCPVSLDDLRVLTVNHWGFDGRVHAGQLIVNKAVAGKLATVFRRLYELRFPIREMRLRVAYGPNSPRDESGGFDCRQAVPSPCVGGKGTGHWSMHAYGEAVDLNPVENPYVGCGMSHDPAGRKYLDRSHLQPGMVTPEVVAAFAAVGWGWGGSWTGSTKDYMHFSATGH
jgi:hypothetical protein